MKNTTTFIIIGIVVVLVGGYFYMSGTSGSELPVTVSASADSTSTPSQFESLVAQVTPLSFDTSIFSDPRFEALHDMTTPFTPVTVGRTDPFAPI
ncbi:MAG TPA: hypothetical protein VF829_02895 [Candidatus Paceibacterota bacterium]